MARNSESIELTPYLDGAATSPISNTHMKAVVFYYLSPAIYARNMGNIGKGKTVSKTVISPTAIGNDFMRIQIDGDGKGRKTFQFDHTKEWMINRYRVAPPRSPALAASDNAASASAATPSSDDVD